MSNRYYIPVKNIPGSSQYNKPFCRTETSSNLSKDRNPSFSHFTSVNAYVIIALVYLSIELYPLKQYFALSMTFLGIGNPDSIREIKTYAVSPTLFSFPWSSYKQTH